jgi:hypothetical protein
MITVEMFQDIEDRLFWHAKEVKLLRGPFADREEADDDADLHAQSLIAALAEHGLHQR